MHVTNSMTRNHKNDPGTWIFPCHFYEKQDWKLLLKIILMKTDKLVDIIIFIMLNKELRSILGMKITSDGPQFVGNKKNDLTSTIFFVKVFGLPPGLNLFCIWIRPRFLIIFHRLVHIFLMIFLQHSQNCFDNLDLHHWPPDIRITNSTLQCLQKWNSSKQNWKWEPFKTIFHKNVTFAKRISFYRLIWRKDLAKP